MDSNNDNSSFWVIFLLIIMFGSYFFIKFEKENRLKDIETNYSEVKGEVVDFREISGTKQSPRKYMIDVEYQVNNLKYSISEQLNRNWIYQQFPLWEFRAKILVV